APVVASRVILFRLIPEMFSGTEAWTREASGVGTDTCAAAAAGAVRAAVERTMRSSRASRTGLRRRASRRGELGQARTGRFRLIDDSPWWKTEPPCADRGRSAATDRLRRASHSRGCTPLGTGSDRRTLSNGNQPARSSPHTAAALETAFHGQARS